MRRILMLMALLALASCGSPGTGSDSSTSSGDGAAEVQPAANASANDEPEDANAPPAERPATLLEGSDDAPAAVWDLWRCSGSGACKPLFAEKATEPHDRADPDTDVWCIVFKTGAVMGWRLAVMQDGSWKSLPAMSTSLKNMGCEQAAVAGI